jgi:hypothetical protein
MSENSGPMGLANQEIRDAIDAFGAEQREGRRLTSLVHRTDAMLNQLEMLNLLRVTHTPASWRSDLTALVADLPFEYERRIGHRLPPTRAIDLVFDIQEGLLRSVTGTAHEGDLLEVPS